MAAALLCLVQGFYIGLNGLVEGVSIIVGTTLIILVLAFGDYSKDR